MAMLTTSYWPADTSVAVSETTVGGIWRRAEQMEETRQRIVEATVKLHESVGLAATTIAAIADLAGVTRLTVYRHFPDEAALFGACSADWLSRQRPPDPSAWSLIADPAERLATGLADLYRFYRAGAAMLSHLYRDLATLPPELRQAIRDRDGNHADLLAAPFGGAAAEQRRIRAVIGHAISFWTWQSLCVDQGLPDGDAVRVMVGAVQAVF
jgi:AcrR family transcriptional regulator